jgi:uncharacterized membrane protein HdeD (DUF308 family)
MDLVSERYFSGYLRGEPGVDVRETAQGTSKWFMTVGVLLIVAGAAALIYTFTATVATVYVIGSMLLLGGIFYGITTFGARKWTTALLDMLLCALYVIAAIAAFRRPVAAA